MGINKSTAAVHGSQPVGVAVGAEPGIVAALQHRLPKLLDVRFDGLRIQAWEKRVVLCVDLAIRNSCLVKKPGQTAASGAIHRVDHKPPARGSDSIEMNEALEPLQVWAHQVHGPDGGRAPFLWMRP